MNMIGTIEHARALFDSSYAGRAKMREIGYSVILDGRTWYKGKYIGEI